MLLVLGFCISYLTLTLTLAYFLVLCPLSSLFTPFLHALNKHSYPSLCFPTNHYYSYSHNLLPPSSFSGDCYCSLVIDSNESPLCFFFFLLTPWIVADFASPMGPVRGFKKKRKPEKKHDKNGSGSGSPEGEGPVDWWDDLSKRMNGRFLSFCLLLCSIIPFMFALRVFVFFLMCDVSFC